MMHSMKRKSKSDTINTRSMKRKRVGALQPQFRRVSIPATRHQTRGPELKSMDTVYAAQALDTTATFSLLNGVQNGSAFYNRIGNKIEMKSLEIRCPVSYDAAPGTPGPEYIRIIVVYDAQTNGAFPTYADVFTSYDNAGGTTSTSHSFLNMNNRERFKVLMDDTIHLPNNGNTAINNAVACLLDTNRQETNIHRYIRLPRLVCNYKASSNPSVVGDITTGGIYLIAISDQLAANSPAQIIITSRLRYYDS